MAKLNDKKNKRQGAAGKIVCIIQLILSIILLVQGSVIPGKYLVIIVLAVLGLFALTFGLQFSKGKGKVPGIIISIIVSLLLIAGIFGLHKMNHFIDAIGTDGLKIDNMVVAVALIILPRLLRTLKTTSSVSRQLLIRRIQKLCAKRSAR